MDLPQLLASVQNQDATIRTQAEAALEAAGQQNMGQLMMALVAELGKEQQAETIRQQAGMYVKMLLTAQDESIKQAKMHQWSMVEPPTKAQIKATLLQVLHSESQAARHTAALIIGKMGAIELPTDQWPEMLQALLENITGNFADGTKVVSLEALGYMCELWEPEDMNQQQTNQILTCIVDGIRADRPDSIRFAAAVALSNSLYFTKNNFDSKDERDMIMQVICEATQSPDVRVRRAAYEGISRIAQLYYPQLDSYMTALFQLTVQTIQKDKEEVALQAVEFWSTLCDEEAAIGEETEEYGMENVDRTSRNYVAMAVPHLVPLLLETLTKQQEDHDDDEWGIATAGATCLGLVAQLVEDPVVDVVVPYVTANIQHSDWHHREAAIMAFGSVLEGPSPDKLRPLVSQAMPVLINAMQDPNVVVKDTATWTIGKICDLHATSIPADSLTHLLGALGQALDDIGRVCKQACFALDKLGQAFEGQRSATNALSPYFRGMMLKLLGVLNREDLLAEGSNMPASAFEALNSLVTSSADDVRADVLLVLGAVLDLLQSSFDAQVLSAEDRDKQQGLQSLLCGSIQVICQKLGKDVVPQSDRIMMNLLRVLQNRNAVAQEEAFLAAGALADCMPWTPTDEGFKKYMQHFLPMLLQGLSNHEEYQVCCVAVGVVGDISRALGKQMFEYSDNIFRWLLQNLEDPNIHRSVKPPILACLGDICLALGGEFERFLQVTVNMLTQVQGKCLPFDVNDLDEDFVEYLNELCATVLEAYTSIINGLNDDDKAQLMLPYLPHIVQFLTAVAQNETRSDDVTSKTVGLIGDIAKNIGPSAKPALSVPQLGQLVKRELQSDDDTQKSTAQWALKHLESLGIS